MVRGGGEEGCGESDKGDEKEASYAHFFLSFKKHVPLFIFVRVERDRHRHRHRPSLSLSLSLSLCLFHLFEGDRGSDRESALRCPQKRPTIEAKEAYYRGKRDLL